MLQFLSVLWNYIVISAPYLLLGLFLSGIIRSFISINKIKSHLGKENFFSVLKATLIGVPLPLCSCSVIPTAITLKKSGASQGATSAFVITTPETGVDSLLLTYGLMGLPLTLFRLITAFLSGIVAGIFQLLFIKKVKTPSPDKEDIDCCKKANGIHHSSKKYSFFEKLKEGFYYSFVDLLDDMAGWLAFGILLGGLIDFLVPPDFFSQINPLTSKFMVIILSIPLYICAQASTPIAASLILKGLSPGTILLFLLLGPATNLAGIIVLQKYLGKKGMILNIVAILVVAFIFSFLADNFISAESLRETIALSQHEHEDSSWMKNTAAILFSILMGQSLLRSYVLKWIKK